MATRTNNRQTIRFQIRQAMRKARARMIVTLVELLRSTDSAAAYRY